MRRQLILLAVTTLLITTLTRILATGLYASDQAYQTLLKLPYQPPETYLFAATLSITVTTLVLFVAYTKKTKTPPEALLILALSPAYITAAITEPTAALLGALTITAALTYKHPASALAVIAAASIHATGGLLALAYIIAKTTQKKQLTAIVTTVLATTALILTNATIQLHTSLAELQAIAAPSLLILLLAITGAALLWDENNYQYLLLLLITAASALILPELRVAAALAAAILAGNALSVLRKHTWALEKMKGVTLLFILLALLYTASSSLALTINADPQPDIKELAQTTTSLVGSQSVFTLSNQEHALRWHAINTTQENKQRILETRSSEALTELTTPFILLETTQEAPNLRFVLQNSQRFTKLQTGSHELWRRVEER